MTIEFYTERTDVPVGLEELLERVARSCVEAEGVLIARIIRDNYPAARWEAWISPADL